MNAVASVKRRKKLSAQYLTWYIHSLFGLKLSLLLSVVLISGGLAVVDREIDWLIYPEMRADVQPDQVPLNPGEIADKLKAYDPSISVYYIQTFPEQPYMATLVDIDRPDGTWALMWLNPYTGEIQGETDMQTPGNFIARLHGDLFLPYGRMIVNFTGVLVLIGLITGLIAFPKFWRYFFRLPRTGNVRVFLGDLHKLVGLWSLWIVLFIGVSGSWWFYNYPLVTDLSAPNLLENNRPGKPILTHDQMASTPDFKSGAELVEAAQKAYPGIEFTMFTPPEHNSEPYTFTGLGGEWLVNMWASNKIYMNPYTAEVTQADPVADVSAGQRVDMALGSLHYGNWGYGSAHLPVKIAWLIGGLAMGFLSVSGMLIYYKRARKAGKKLKTYARAGQYIPQLNTAQGQRNWRIIRPWGGPMGSFKYVNIALLAGIIIGIPAFFDKSADDNGHLYSPQRLGPWEVSAFASANEGEAPIVAGGSTTLKVNIPFEAYDNIKFIYARVGKPRRLRAPGSLIHGMVGVKHVHLPIPARAKPGSELWITAETWDGQFYQTHWPLFPEN